MITMQRRAFLAFTAAGTLAAPAVLRAQAATLADTMAGDNRFTRFLDLITRASMVESFRQAQPMTVFAPTDQAFFGAPAGLLQDLVGGGSGENRSSPQDRNRLSALINYHVVPGAYPAASLTGGERRLRTVNGADIAVRVANNAVNVWNPAPAQQSAGFSALGANANATEAQVVQADIPASNGIIHAISLILWP